MRAWRVEVDPPLPYPEARFAMEVDPRRGIVRLGHRVPDTGDLEIQCGAIARSFFEQMPVTTDAAAAWLAGEEAAGLLATIEAGFSCDTLWSGDMVVTWSEGAWEAGRTLYLRVEALLA
jgi:hypothetical protein